ncbi:Ig-like domain-containing protein [Methanobrevibacter gottschalkii]|uniref:Ig-like domain-containing protein n=1 Tax=Methanobrevibacter gottschalkii TaxID=190974 RepID=UPI0026EF6AB3|nr:Ig-like domain-containing protein [Methanobrevibacter gottschalkii]
MWWWDNEVPYFYDNATKEKYLEEFGVELYEYGDVFSSYNGNVIGWLNQQLMDYNRALGEVVKNYSDGLFMGLLYVPGVLDDSVPQMIRDVNTLKNADEIFDVLQIEDYDWVICESSNHDEVYDIAKKLGFNGTLHYFGGFVQDFSNAESHWDLIEQSIDDALQNGFSEVFIWAGSQIRRDNMMIGYDDNLLDNLTPTVVLLPEFVSVGEIFDVTVNTQEWINGKVNVYQNGKLLASGNLTNGHSSITVNCSTVGLNELYIEFDYDGGKFHLTEEVNVIENSKNINLTLSDEIEYGSDLNINFSASQVNVSIDGKSAENYIVENDEFKLSNLSTGYHRISLKYDGGGEMYSNTFNVLVYLNTCIEAKDVTVRYNSGGNLVLTLKDTPGNVLSGEKITVKLNNKYYSRLIDAGGQVKLAVPVMTPKTYTAEISFSGDGIYKKSNALVKVNVIKATPKLTASSKTFNIKTKTKYYSVTLKDNNNKVMKNVKVTLKVNGVTYSTVTDSYGVAKFSLKKLTKKGTYNAYVSYAGNGNYNRVTKTVKIAVKVTPKITAYSKVFKKSTVTKKYIITLKNELYKVMKYTKVTLKINGKTYSAKTNRYGVAAFKIIKLFKKGRFTAVVNYAGSSYYYAVSKKVIITVR